MGSVEEVRIARRTGFCYGVRGAIHDYARLAAAQGKSTHTLGKVVHNEGVITQLQSQGIQTVDTLDDVDQGAAVVIRARSVTPEVMSRAGSKASRSSTAYRLSRSKGYRSCRRRIHDRAARDAAPSRGCRSPRQPRGRDRRRRGRGLGRIPRTKRMALISQSTQPPWKFEKLAGHLVSPLPRAQGREHRLR